MASPLSTELRASLQARLAPFEALDTCHREVMQQLQTLARQIAIALGTFGCSM